MSCGMKELVGSVWVKPSDAWYVYGVEVVHSLAIHGTSRLELDLTMQGGERCKLKRGVIEKDATGISNSWQRRRGTGHETNS